MPNQYRQSDWNESAIAACRSLVQLGVAEDFAGQQDWTTVATIDEAGRGAASVVSRQPGVACGIHAIAVVIEEMGLDIQCTPITDDGQPLDRNTPLADLQGNARDLLRGERLLLNLIGRMSGIATLTKQYVNEVEGTAAQIYDTRKTTPGWRLLEKYAVRCGGGVNHRLGLYDGLLIKDNHLAFAASRAQTPFEAVTLGREFLKKLADETNGQQGEIPVEVEVDNLDQLRSVLPASPDIVLLDNMSNEQLSEAIIIRNDLAPNVVLEASGGVNLSTLRGIAETGVDRISVGALTHSAIALDIGLDWEH